MATTTTPTPQKPYLPEPTEKGEPKSKGMSNKTIGEALFISDKTVSTYKGRIQEKLGLSSLAALIEFASLQKLID